MKLEIINLSKSFGDKAVLSNVSFDVHGGSALGLLGRNGAGKTTTLRIIMDVFGADGGKVLLDGAPISDAKSSIGYLPEERGMYPKTKVCDQAIYFGKLRGLSAKAAEKSLKKWLERLEISEYYDRKLMTLSKGNQQKVQLAVTLITDPDVVILDEPFSGLDPVNAQILKDVVTEQMTSGKLVLFSSHQMNYVEQFCDHVAMLHHGEIVLTGKLKDIKRSFPRTGLFLHADGGDSENDALRAALEKSPEIRAAADGIRAFKDGTTVHLKRPEGKDIVLGELARCGIGIDRFEVMEPSLEEIFIQKAGESN